MRVNNKIDDLIYEIEESISTGKCNATLIPCNGNTNLFGVIKPSPEKSIQEAKTELLKRGWKWNNTERQLERRGWLIWFRSQGLLSPPIAQWSRITVVKS